VSHAPVSVVVTASGSPDDFASCLSSLRPSLGARDEVVCVVPADRPDLRREVAGQRWLTVLDAPAGDRAAGVAAGVAATTHPVVVLLDGDVILSPQWLDPVVQAFADPDVVAAGPRCHRSYGPQGGVELPRSAMTDAAAFKAYARVWRQRYRDEVRAVDRLGPVCAAVRRDAFERAGGTLSYEHLRTEGRLVVVNSVLVAHIGAGRCTLRVPVPGERPLISASMIVKDEEDVLGASLTALREFADEIVVYDTGSTDRTVEIARQHGARVVEGFWNDHFAEARNRSIAHCRGEWIFVVDADEVATGDPAALRAELAKTTGAARMIHVQSLEGHGHEGRGVLSVRFFRGYGRYDGRLHEQVVDGITGEALTGPALPAVELTHSGYTAVRYAAKNKGARNVRLAELGVDDHDGSPGALVNLARSHAFAGDNDAAVEVCQRALATDPGGYRQTFTEVLVQSAGAAGRFDVATAALAELRDSGDNALLVDDLDVRLRFTQADYAGALEILANLPDTAMDQRLMVLGRRQLANVEILSLFQLGRREEAAELLSACLAEGELSVTVPQMAFVFGGNVSRIAELVPRRSLRALLLAATEAPAQVLDGLLEALWSRYPGEVWVLALAARAGGYFPLIRGLEWAARLRQHGFAESCTLLAIAAAPERSARDRSLAAAVALEMYGDERAMPLLDQALAAVSTAEAPALLEEMRLLAPGIAAAVEPATV
jgi:GT2 family glycosyltransferase/tetratricopeptide (TPR) repeat protein